jgi:hypothetical protein
MKRKTQERMERRSGKRSSTAGSEKMERVGDRLEKMEGYCSTGQSPQWAVAPTEEEEECYMPSCTLYSCINLVQLVIVLLQTETCSCLIPYNKYMLCDGYLLVLYRISTVE